MKKFFIVVTLVILSVVFFNSTVFAQDDTADYLKMGYLLSQKGEYSQAIDCYTSAINTNIKDIDVAYILRGIARVELKDFKGATNDFSKAILINPKNYYPYAIRAWIKSQQKDYKGAIKDYTEAINLDSSKEFLYFERGRNRYIMKDYTGALIDCTNSLNTNPNYDAYVLRAGLRESMNDYEGSVKDLSSAIKIRDNVPVLYYQRACAYNHLEQYKYALQDFNKAIKLDPKYADAYYSRGLTKAMTKQTSKAMEDIEKAKDLYLEQNNLTKYEEVKSFINKLNNK